MTTTAPRRPPATSALLLTLALAACPTTPDRNDDAPPAPSRVLAGQFIVQNISPAGDVLLINRAASTLEVLPFGATETVTLAQAETTDELPWWSRVGTAVFTQTKADYEAGHGALHVWTKATGTRQLSSTALRMNSRNVAYTWDERWLFFLAFETWEDEELLWVQGMNAATGDTFTLNLPPLEPSCRPQLVVTPQPATRLLVQGCDKGNPSSATLRSLDWSSLTTADLLAENLRRTPALVVAAGGTYALTESDEATLRVRIDGSEATETVGELAVARFISPDGARVLVHEFSDTLALWTPERQRQVLMEGAQWVGTTDRALTKSLVATSIAYVETEDPEIEATHTDVVYVDLQTGRKETLLETPTGLARGAFTGDGRYVAWIDEADAKELGTAKVRLIEGGEVREIGRKVAWIEPVGDTHLMLDDDYEGGANYADDSRMSVHLARAPFDKPPHQLEPNTAGGMLLSNTKGVGFFATDRGDDTDGLYRFELP